MCTPANENATACFGTAYDVPSALINPAFVANGGALGVNLCDSFANCDTTNGRDPTNTISDQLYLQVGPQNVAAGTNSVLWCWDSDLEPNVNICQDQITLSSNQLSTVLEPQPPAKAAKEELLTSRYSSPIRALARSRPDNGKYLQRQRPPNRHRWQFSQRACSAWAPTGD